MQLHMLIGFQVDLIFSNSNRWKPPEKIKSDRTQIVTVLNRIARNFVRKEFGMNKDQIKSIESYQIDEKLA